MDELYQSQILALARAARASADIAHPTHHAVVKNPTCGDEVSLYLCLDDDHIEAIHVAVSGCALCEAGAGLLLQKAQKARFDDMKCLASSLEAFMASQGYVATDDKALLAFTPVRAVKNRHKCVTLAFKALQKLAPIT